jgi:hypothetical protein
MKPDALIRVMRTSSRTRNGAGALALCILSGAMVSACAPEEDGLPDDPTTEEVRALTATDPSRTWRGVTGLLRDIATANGPSSRWGIDTSFGQNIFGQSGNRVVRWSGDRWVATAGRGARIALRGTGDANLDGISDVFVPWVVTSDGRIWRATDTSGNVWIRMPELSAGVTARDIGSGGAVGNNMAMWSAGSDGRVYQFFDAENQWRPMVTSPFGEPLSILPTNVLRVAGPVRMYPGQPQIEVVALTYLGEVWAFFPNSRAGWTRLDTGAEFFRTDVSSEASMTQFFRDRFLTSTMVTTSQPGDHTPVQAFNTDRGGFWSTGPYSVGGVPISSTPIAVSSDVDRHRVWIVTADTHVYYGE